MKFLATTFTLFIICIIGILFNFKNFLIILMSIEMILLSLNLNFIFFSIVLDDLYGQIFSLFITTVAAAESGVGLGILIVYFRIRHVLSVVNKPVLKG